ncbi:uncharacterized protein LOC134290750 [Aedes albopictus]|uniref:Reverse transcriptase domain-containing protein n=1 Tax=Aedes albopictus TaxID=7160 RepID=A0ABM2A5L7_AEDAL
MTLEQQQDRRWRCFIGSALQIQIPFAGVQFAITNDGVIAAGKDLKSSTGCGPDGIPSLVIKRCLSSLAVPLITVFNLWHGFIPKRSTSDLTCFTSYLIRQFQSGHQVDAIYTDLSTFALAKIDKLGMSNNLVIWLRPYLTGRSMSVKIGDYISSPFTVWSGVPQGSHLRSFLFLLYMNDVNYILKCLKLSYADDLKLYFVIKQREDAVFLQRQLEAFAVWCALNRMSLNVSEC